MLVASADSVVGDNPQVLLGFDNTTDDTLFGISITLNGGPAPGKFKLIDVQDVTFPGNPPARGSGSIFGHALDPNANVVGEVKATTLTQEPNSGYGPGEIPFDAAGHRLATPLSANAPAFDAPDAVATEWDPDFTGTSAAAPGDVFVQNGGRLQIDGGTLAGGSVTAGAGTNGGQDGQAIASGIFINQGDVHLSTQGGETLTISDVIGADIGGNVIIGGAGIVVLNTVNTYSGNTIQDYAAPSLSGRIDAAGVLQGASAGTAGFSGDMLTITGSGTSVVLTVVGAFDPANLHASLDAAGTGTDVTYVACFAAGTRIATPGGPVAVEDLRAGDHVVSAFGGAPPVVWLGHRRIDCRRHPRPHEVWPVRVTAGAFGDRLAQRDLLLSPDHAVYVEDVLIPVRHLVNGATVRQEATEKITYFHIELPAHDVILAEGLPAESYLDTGNRAAFDNGGAAVQMHPAPGLFDPGVALRAWAANARAPLVTSGEKLAAVKARLLARAALLGHATTDEPLLRLLVHGRRLLPTRGGNVYRFALPPNTTAGTLLSRSFVPAQLRADSEDHRRLGVAVTRLTLDGCEVDPASFGAGWHAREPGLCWTSGAATVALHGAAELALRVWSGRYRSAGPATLHTRARKR